VADWLDTVFALNRDGTLKWALSLGSPTKGVTSQMNLDREGNLYFIAIDGILHKVSPAGETLWRLKLTNFGSSASSVVFAPDGKTMYVTADKLYAVSTDAEIRWAYQNPEATNTWSTYPLVDGSGNIYLYHGFLRIKPNGIPFPLLEFPDSVEKHPVNLDIDPTVDKNGNSYIGMYGLTSFDYNFKFRWSKNVKLSAFFSLISDKDNKIYFLTEDSKLICIDQEGIEKWQLQLDGRYYYSPAIANGRLYLGLVRGSKRYFCSIK
jgi:outer membrane protein assembly factor BamB